LDDLENISKRNTLFENLLGILDDFKSWINVIFIEQDTEDIHYMSISFDNIDIDEIMYSFDIYEVIESNRNSLTDSKDNIDNTYEKKKATDGKSETDAIHDLFDRS
ncbi:hypothetical protein, partial [Candidatus Albibeggiatoa sp. nov. BB20]|uniref:hypothetical protein n=1 Tax=Candidatus Albibeggiatoa sp. nov. BB20 TaxID=3162723 RepID=UPI0033654EA5